MAKFSIDIPRDLLIKFNRLEQQTPEILKKSVAEGAKPVENAIRKELRTVLSEGHKTGELISSLGATKPDDKYGVVNVKIGFNEPRKNDKGKRIKTGKLNKHAHRDKGQTRSYYTQTNAMIATVLEYGKRDGSQRARPFIEPAKRKSEDECLQIMRETFEEEVDKL